MHFLFALFFTLIPNVESSLRSGDCTIEAKYTITQLTPGSDVKIEVIAEGGKAPYYYLFFDERDNPVSWDFKKNDFVGPKNKLPKKIKVIDSLGCFKWIEFNESSN